jgi:hypothetical protein
MTSLRNSVIKLAYTTQDKALRSELLRLLKTARFEKGKPADPTENMDEEAKAKWMEYHGQIGDMKEASLSAGDAAKWADAVAKEAARLLPNGTTKHPSLNSRLGGVIAYGKDKENPKYISLISGVGGKDHDFVWAKVSYYEPGSYSKGHGFKMNPRTITTIQDDQFKDVREAAKAVAQAVKGSSFAKP